MQNTGTSNHQPEYLLWQDDRPDGWRGQVSTPSGQYAVALVPPANAPEQRLPVGHRHRPGHRQGGGTDDN